jgi:hypothetical protein
MSVGAPVNRDDCSSKGRLLGHSRPRIVTGRGIGISRPIAAALVLSVLGVFLFATAKAATASWSLSPVTYDFGPVETGTRSAPATLTLTNTGEAALPAPRVGLEFERPDQREGDESGIFEDGAFDCAIRTSLQPGESCALTLIFQPANRGPRGGTIRFVDPASELDPAPATATFTGVGIGPVISFSPPGLSLTSRLLGIELNPPGILTVSNTGDADLDVSEVAFQGLGSNPNGFKMVGGTCHAGSVVPTGSSCTIEVTYTPTQAANFVYAELKVVDNGPHGFQSVEVVGGGAGDPPESPSLKTTYISKRPSARTTSRRASFHFAVEGGGVPFVCKLDNSPYRPCRSPRTYRRLAIGSHVFAVKPRIHGRGIWAGAAIARFRVMSGQHQSRTSPAPG